MKYLFRQLLDVNNSTEVRFVTEKWIRFMDDASLVVRNVVKNDKNEIVLSFNGNPKTFNITEYEREIYVSLIRKLREE
jgi:hypothetical protein